MRILAKITIRKFFFIFTIIACNVAPSIAQPNTADSVSFTIEELWKKVSANSKVVNIRKLQIMQQQEKVENARVSRLPDISLNGEYEKISNLPQYENGIFHHPTYYPIAHTYYSLGSSMYFNLYHGGQSGRQVNAEKISLKISEQQLNLSESEIKLLASAYYLDLLRGKAFQTLLLQDIEEQDKVLLKIKAVYKNGAVLKSDVLRAELKLSNQKLQVKQISNENAVATQKINLLVGQDEDMLIEPLQSFLPDTVQLVTYEELLTKAASGAPEINMAKQEHKLTELRLRDVKSHVLPSIDLFANYNYSFPQGTFYPYVRALSGLGMAGIRASFSISSLVKTKHQVNFAELAVQQSRLELMDLHDHIKSQIKETYLQFKLDQESIKVALSNIAQATENLRIIKNSYLNQTSLITDYLDADVQLLQSGFDLSAARISAQLHYYQLQKIIGHL